MLTLINNSAMLLVASTTFPRIWYSLPLIVVISLVYGATRHEHLREIAVHTLRSAVWVVGFMAIIFAIIYVASFWN